MIHVPTLLNESVSFPRYYSAQVRIEELFWTDVECLYITYFPCNYVVSTLSSNQEHLQPLVFLPKTPKKTYMAIKFSASAPSSALQVATPLHRQSIKGTNSQMAVTLAKALRVGQKAVSSLNNSPAHSSQHAVN